MGIKDRDFKDWELRIQISRIENDLRLDFSFNHSDSEDLIFRFQVWSKFDAACLFCFGLIRVCMILERGPYVTHFYIYKKHVSCGPSAQTSEIKIQVPDANSPKLSNLQKLKS